MASLLEAPHVGVEFRLGLAAAAKAREKAAFQLAAGMSGSRFAPSGSPSRRAIPEWVALSFA
jgi:hypothetical protein